MSHPFFIWTVQRTGGTSLAELLMKMSEHRKAEHEPFNWRRHTPRQFAAVARNWVETKDLATLQSALGAIFSEGWLIKHCYELHGTPFNIRILQAAARTNYRHILLLRRDELQRLVSKYIAEANGTWFRDYAAKVYAGISAGDRRLQPLPVDEIVATYEHVHRTTERIRDVLARLNVDRQEIWYEDIYTGDRETRMAHLNALFRFLEFTPETIAAHQADIEEKIFAGGQNTRDILEFVPNLAEVKQALAAAGLKPTTDSTRHQETMTVTIEAKAGDKALPKSARQINDDSATHIHTRGYRAFVGGANVWEAIGKLQFEFLKKRGMKPSDKLVDVACGALRGGLHYIKYLEPGNYYGIDKHIELIIYGTAREVTIPVFRQKMPHFAVSDAFEFHKLGEGFTYGIAQSLFSHLVPDDIRLCLRNLHEVAADGCKFYATFFESDKVDDTNPEKSHSAAGFRFTRKQMEAFGADTGWQPNYIGGWGHPRGQKVIEYVRPNR